MSRGCLVIANWKMHKTSRESEDFIGRLAPIIEGCQARVFLAAPFTSIAASFSAAKHSNITIGAQNMNDARDGAFTGEVSSLMLKEAGASFVILGHSERRQIFHESDELIHRKILRALQDDIQPVLCVGETKQEREAGKTEDVILRQIESALQKVPVQDAERLVLAYEPVWAIGMGHAATPKQIEEAHAFCRKCLEKLFGKSSLHIPIIYGGSVHPDNVREIVKQKDIDGVLVGGASLDADTLSAIILNCEGIR